jgi:hypothetical protein
MTLFGKIVVVLNLVLSLLMAAWALGLWTNRIDWSNNKGADLQPPGELTLRKAEAERAWNEAPGGFAAYRDAKAALFAREDGKEDGKDGRAADRNWYAAEIEHLRTGATEANPGRMVDLALGQGLPTPDPRNYDRPTMKIAKDKFGKPIQSIAAYAKRETELFKELADVQDEYQKSVEEDTRLTERLIGPKGLQQRILDEQAKLAEVLKEAELLRPLLINAVVESELILKRREFLKARIAEILASDATSSQ